MRRWIERERDYGEAPEIDVFLAEIEAVCRRRGLVIVHEDHHGAFQVEELDEHAIERLRRADDARR